MSNKSMQEELRKVDCGSEALYGGRGVSKDIGIAEREIRQIDFSLKETGFCVLGRHLYSALRLSRSTTFLNFGTSDYPPCSREASCGAL